MIVPDNQHAGPGDGGDGLHTLCYSPFSLYSILARFAFELGHSLNPDSSPAVRLRLVNLQREANLTEEYLTVSPKGQVPVLVCSSESGSPEVLEESRDILSWLCKAQPELSPEDHRDDIDSLLSAFFAFHAKPLAVKPDERSSGIPNKAAEMLERTDITDSHRRCLEMKSIFHDTIHGGSLNPEHVQEVEAAARNFLSGVSDVLQRHRQDGDSGGKYIFGSTPTVLDAVATTFLARLMDMKRDDMVDAVTRDYALGVLGTEEWRKTTQGRPTIYDESLGQVADMNLF